MVLAGVCRTEEDQRKAMSIKGTWKTVGLDEVGSTRARANMGRTIQEGPV